MVTDFFGSLLQDLSQALQIPGLHPDANNTCLIKFKDGLLVQLEVDRGGQFIILGSDLGPVPVGRYRENLFFEALKSNALPPPRYGTFAYSKQADRLILFKMFSLNTVSAEKIADFLTLFLEKARTWKEAIARNDIPVVSSATTPRSTGMFGLRP